MGFEKANNCETLEDVYAHLKKLEEETRRISSPEELNELEEEIMSYTNCLAALLLKKSPDEPGFPRATNSGKRTDSQLAGSNEKRRV